MSGAIPKFPHQRALRPFFYVTQLALMLALFGLLSGCASRPARTTPSLEAQQAQVLRSLGFHQSDEGWLLALPEAISFEFGQATLNEQTKRSIARFAAEMNRVEIHMLRVEGHTDAVGPHDFNVELSRQRAEAVAQEFIVDGYTNANIIRNAFGPDHPSGDNHTRSGRTQNRRVEIIIPLSALAAVS